MGLGCRWCLRLQTPPEEGTASSRETDAPLFLQQLFKVLIDRLGGGGCMCVYVWGPQLEDVGLRGGEMGEE